MAIHSLAGKPVPADLLTNIPRLIAYYYTEKPDPAIPSQMVSFGTSGHRGTSFKRKFNEDHILAITQAICEYRHANGISGPLYLGMDTHALSEAALMTAIEVLAGNEVNVMVQSDMGYTPTPVISHAILTYNRHRRTGLADGIIITPSHNPPEDGGLKYNPPSGGPANTQITKQIEIRANEIIADGMSGVVRKPFSQAMLADTTHIYDYMMPYVNDLGNVVNMEAIAGAGLQIGVDPMGGSGISYWEPIASKYKLNLNVINTNIDPTFSFMPIDKDGKIRMDCSSPYAMANLIKLKDTFDIAFGNDPDYDRHGIVTRSSGLLNPNHYLAVAIEYLFQNRPQWPADAAIGKTLVSSSMIDRVADAIDRNVSEVPVGFKWFVDHLLDGSYGFGGEESAGASFLRMDGTVWSTDKDGIIMNLLAAEITAVTGKDPGEQYKLLEKRFGSPLYDRVNAPANDAQKLVLKNLSADMVTTDQMAGDPIIAKLTNAQGNGAAIGGLKIVTDKGWFAARPSGTEDIYKIYAESFKDETHLRMIQQEAQLIVNNALKNAGVA